MDKGVVTEASVEDIKLLPGVRRTMFHRTAATGWHAEVVEEVKSGRARFILNTGDMVWWGKQGAKPSENPYWKLVYKNVLDQLPPPDDQMQAAGLPGRVFPAVGNHEVWEDSDVAGAAGGFPVPEASRRLRTKGSSTSSISAASASSSCGPANTTTARRRVMGRHPAGVRSADEADAAWLDEAKAAGMKKVFISFHAPTFCRAGLGAIPESQNPHKFIAPYAKDMDIVVFNGHVHTTEHFEVDGIKYFVMGGGGAEQDPILPGRRNAKVPADYPPDLYWKGENPRRTTTTCWWT